jgi:hypothetical protein
MGSNPVVSYVKESQRRAKPNPRKRVVVNFLNNSMTQVGLRELTVLRNRTGYQEGVESRRRAPKT